MKVYELLLANALSSESIELNIIPTNAGTIAPPKNKSSQIRIAPQIKLSNQGVGVAEAAESIESKRQSFFAFICSYPPNA